MKTRGSSNCGTFIPDYVGSDIGRQRSSLIMVSTRVCNQIQTRPSWIYCTTSLLISLQVVSPVQGWERRCLMHFILLLWPDWRTRNTPKCHNANEVSLLHSKLPPSSSREHETDSSGTFTEVQRRAVALWKQSYMSEHTATARVTNTWHNSNFRHGKCNAYARLIRQSWNATS